MIGEKLNSEGYKRQVYSKFVSFSEKSPLLLDLKTGSENGVDGLKVSIRGKDKSFFYPWDFETEPKSFIHRIKVDLRAWYPILEETIYDEHETTADEIRDFLERGYLVTEIPRTQRVQVGTKTWLIDKVVVWRDIAILEDVATGDQFRFKMNTNLVLFLKKYRSGGFSGPSDAGEAFFSRSSLLNKIENA